MVISGDYRDPYTGQMEHFTKQQADKTQVDHTIPLAYAWQHGASTWTDDQRTHFANDLAHPELVLTDAHSNDAKLDKGPAQWLPPNAEDLCTYATSWIQVASAWHLSITIADAQSLHRALTHC